MNDAEKIRYLEDRHLKNIRARDEARNKAEQAIKAKDVAEKAIADLRWHLQVPDGAKRLDAWEFKGQLIICGTPDEDDAHNCDAMGCSSVSHVIIRMPLEQAKRISNGV